MSAARAVARAAWACGVRVRRGGGRAPLAALLAGPTGQLRGDVGPALGAVVLNDLRENLILLLGPRLLADPALGRANPLARLGARLERLEAVEGIVEEDGGALLLAVVLIRIRRLVRRVVLHERWLLHREHLALRLDGRGRRHDSFSKAVHLLSRGCRAVGASKLARLRHPD
jgi:hypothetical protein